LKVEGQKMNCHLII